MRVESFHFFLLHFLRFAPPTVVQKAAGATCWWLARHGVPVLMSIVWWVKTNFWTQWPNYGRRTTVLFRILFQDAPSLAQVTLISSNTIFLYSVIFAFEKHGLNQASKHGLRLSALGRQQDTNGRWERGVPWGCLILLSEPFICMCCIERGNRWNARLTVTRSCVL